MPDDPLCGFATATLLFDELLGKGAMGAVYRGTQRALGRTVAIKIIAPHLTGDPAHLERFSREAQTLGRVQHPNVITCHDIGPCMGPDGRSMFVMVLEYVDGWSLGSLLQAQRLSVRKVLDLHRQAADGLAAAHRLGIVHRDIKPENIMVTRQGVAKLADFGLAKADDAALLTRSGALMGSPAYMSPEACQGQGVGPASDIYSLGCSLFHALTGTTPFSSTSMLLALQQHVHAPVPLVSSRRADLGALDALVARALAKRSADRFADAAEFASALRAALPGIPGDALVGGGLQPTEPTITTAPVDAARGTLPVQATLRVSEEGARLRLRAPGRRVAAPLLVAAGVCALAVMVWPRHQAPISIAPTAAVLSAESTAAPASPVRNG
ncbi:MAG: serine/threonine protein kinase, partial [Planctomycetes bacterium]|nr:serine/threonine protein kinase [Planctomycetota bacterium]